MPFANSNTITDDVTLTLPHIALEILCPCTKFHSHTRLHNAAASSPSRPREGDSLAINKYIKKYRWRWLCVGEIPHKNCCDLNLGESLCISTFFLFPDSRFNLLNGFDFLFWSILNGVTLKTSNISKWSHFKLWPVDVTWSAIADAWQVLVIPLKCSVFLSCNLRFVFPM